MGEMESYKVMLNGPAPWGFRLQGGKDFSMPLSISRLTPGGKAAQAGVGVGDWVLYIDGESTSAMTHIEAQNRIRACGDRLCLTLSRAQNHLGKPQKVQSLDKKPQEHPSSPKYDPSKLHLIEDSEDWQPRNTSTQSRSFLKLAQLTGTDSFEDHEDELVRKPRGPRVSFWGTEEEWQSMHPPGTPACDPGKLRLMEDAEDWQPRTGTSQSRSFRKLARLTGTDGLEDHENELVRKPSQVSVPDPSPGAAMKTEPGLAPRTPAATPGPTSRPPWAVDPSFAERYAPDKTSTVLSKHSQPATPTPMQNRSSIVQAAQQAPEGPGRTPLCYKCNKIIRGRYLVALGHYYHPEEFTCCQCRKVLDEGGFFEEKGSVFCPKCYDMRYAPSCAKCKKKITGEVMHALKMTWHVQCFTCAACKTPIRNRAFYMEEGQPYCERDYEKMFGTKCRGCDFKIDAGDRFLEALGFSWHDTCFVCAICQTNLEGKTFYSKKDKPLCKSHAFSHV
ncbi:PDZ and LIM domain protein 7 isoform X13 [Cyrtonyx montezumae]|uniref:PDZ and LIM domain protein 7 isoform X13 n=1 Tax=Cyrtonyx montezumae TaxID=9017 RepID=UPI0032DBA7C5